MLAPVIGGLSLFGFGEGLLVQSRLGASPWTVFAEGLGHHLGVSVGTATGLISLFVMLLWIPLKEKPGFGTVANIVIIAEVLNLTVATIPISHQLFIRWAFVFAGVVAIGAGSSLYLTAALGPGPRDGLMTSLHRRLKVSVVYIRLSIEATVLFSGWLLGGTVGLGTAVFAALIGYSIGASLSIVSELVEG
jgi:uncharacterized membrane protein YczE